MKDFILSVILHDDMTVTFKDGINKLNAHQAARQFIYVELSGFSLTEDETLHIAFEQGEALHLNPVIMEYNHETGIYALAVPKLVRDNPGAWTFALYVKSNWNSETGTADSVYPSGKYTFYEHSTIADDGTTVPSEGDMMLAWKETAKNAKDAQRSASNALASESATRTAVYTTSQSEAKAAASALKAEEQAISAGTEKENAKAWALKAETYANIADAAVEKTSKVYHYKGSVTTFAQLPTNAETGDTYNVNAEHDGYPAGTNWAWNGTAWDSLGGKVSRIGLTGLLSDAIDDEGHRTVTDTDKSTWNNAAEKADVHEQRINDSLGKQMQTVLCPHEACITGSGDEAFLDIDDGLVMVDRIEGKTVKTTNLIPYPYHETTKTVNGVTFTDNSDGTVTANGTATGHTAFYLLYKLNSNTFISGNTYHISGCPSGGSYTTYFIQLSDETTSSKSDYGNGASYTLQSNNIRLSISIQAGYTANNLVFRPMLNAGETALPYQPYFKGLKNASFHKIVSTGKNLIDLSGVSLEKTVNGITFTRMSDGQYRLTGTIENPSNSASSSAGIIPKNVYPAGVYSTARYNIGGLDIEFYVSAISARTGLLIRNIDFKNVNINEDFKINSVGIFVNRNISSAIDLVVSTQLEFGAMNTEYEPYKQSVLSLPEAVENAAYNTLDLQAGKNVSQGITKIFEGTEDWGDYSSELSGVYSCELPISAVDNTMAVINNLFPTAQNNGISLTNRVNGKLTKILAAFTKTDYPEFDTIDKFKAYLAQQYTAGNPLVVRYKTAEATEADLPPFPTNKYAVVKGGMQYVDTGVADNPYRYGAYNTIVKKYGVDPISQIFYNADMNKSQQSEIDALKTGKQDVLTFDDTPTAESVNPVTSDGVKAALDLKADKTALEELRAQVADNRTIMQAAQVFTVTTDEDAYTTRRTATDSMTGEAYNLIDGSQAIVKEIRGSTVATTNLFNKDEIMGAGTFANCTETSVSEDKNVLIARGNEVETDEHAFSRGWIRPLANVSNEKMAFLKPGTVKVSADITLLEKGSASASVVGFLYGASQVLSNTAKPITTTKTRYVWELIVKMEGYYYPIFSANSNKIQIENIMIAYEAEQYVPYFKGLKNAYFKEIISTGKNLFDCYGFSAISIQRPQDTRILTNGYGTTISTIEPSNSITVTQLPNNEYYPSSFYNGYFCMGVYGLIDGQRYTLSFDLSITNNPFAVTEMNVLTNGGSATTGKIKNGKFICQFIYKDSGNRKFIEIRNAGVSFTASNFQIEYGDTATDYEPYKTSVLSLPSPVELPAFDTLNFQTGKNVSQGITVTFQGTENVGNYSTADYYIYTMNLKKYGFGNYIGIVNKDFVFGKTGAENAIKGCYIAGLEKQTINFWFHVGDFPNLDTVDKFKAYLAEQYAAGDPLTIRYQTAEIQSETDLNISSDRYVVHPGGSETVEEGGTNNSEYGAKVTIKTDYSTLIKKESTV